MCDIHPAVQENARLKALEVWERLIAAGEAPDLVIGGDTGFSFFLVGDTEFSVAANYASYLTQECTQLISRKVFLLKR